MSNNGILHDEVDIALRVHTMGGEITRFYERLPCGAPGITALVVLKGAFIFAADLLRQIKLPTKVEFIQVRAYDGLHAADELGLVQEPPVYAFQGKHVLIIEDIVDTGRTIRCLLEYVKERKAKSVHVAALLHKPTGGAPADLADFLGFTVNDVFVAGYGLDHNDHKRNIPVVFDPAASNLGRFG